MPTQEVPCSEDSVSLNEPWLPPPEGRDLSRKPHDLTGTSWLHRLRQEIPLHSFPRVEGEAKRGSHSLFPQGPLPFPLLGVGRGGSVLKRRVRDSAEGGDYSAGLLPFGVFRAWENHVIFPRRLSYLPPPAGLDVMEAQGSPLSEALCWIGTHGRREPTPPKPVWVNQGALPAPWTDRLSFSIEANGYWRW